MGAFFFFQAEDGIRDVAVTGVQTCALPISSAPASFFGVVPQAELSRRDAEYMAAGGISAIRVPVIWSTLRPTKGSGYNWTGLDATVTVAARAGMTVLPFFYGTPHWLASKPTTLPIDNATERHAWQDFLTAAVERYGPEGQFWAERRKEAKVDY